MKLYRMPRNNDSLHHYAVRNHVRHEAMFATQRMSDLNITANAVYENFHMRGAVNIHLSLIHI